MAADPPPRRATIIVHTLTHALAAAAVADELKTPVRLASPPLAAFSLGPDVFREMIAVVQSTYPEADFIAVLDCGDAPGVVLSALRRGITGIRVDVNDVIRQKLIDIAEQYGAFLDPWSGDALDLVYEQDPEDACRRWLLERSSG
jgi:hypothetical protein